MALHLEIVTPRGSVVATDAEEVVMPGLLGEFGVLMGHTPFLSAIKPGVVKYKDTAGVIHRLAVGTGFAEVGASEKVLVLTDMHALPGEVDAAEVRGQLTEIDNELKAWTGELNAQHKELREKAEWAQARLDLLEKS